MALIINNIRKTQFDGSFWNVLIKNHPQNTDLQFYTEIYHGNF